ncbi:MAG: extracellular solute-binding protein [Chloroflexi bacterium]|nr:extracellular solute-binding protein [Chloroflexota bacterium]MBI3763979.1 extracellular solute-binding protein [Chloroflexota bacterium]
MKRHVALTLGLMAVLSLIVTACGGAATTAAPAALPYQGVTVNVLTFTGPQIAEPLQRHGPEFEKATGAHINVATVPFSDLYQKALTDFSTGTNSYDVIVFDPQWMGDYVAGGYLEDLTDRVKANKDLQWDDVGAFFRDFSATYQGKTYTIPLDGDFQMVYYRSDLIKTPPETWDDFIALAKEYQGKDLNGDSKPDYGTCIAMKRSAQSYWMVSSIASAFLQSQGTGQGGFFTTDNLQPLYGPNEGFGAALDVYKTLSTLGPPDQLNLDVGDTRGLFTSGRCALSIDWGDIGPLAVDPATSKVQDKVGAVILPGSKKVLDRASGKLVDCDAKTCPYATNGVNHAPFAAFGGWSGAINKNSKANVKDAAFAFLAYVSAPAQSNVDVTIGKTGFNPYRLSQFKSRDAWLKSGMSEKATADYLGAIEASLNSPNMVLDLRIPQNAYYQGTVLDTAIAQFLAGEIDKDATMKQISDGWNKKTDELGRDKQLAAYKATLGVTK